MINWCDRKLCHSPLTPPTITLWKFRSNSKVNLSRQFTSSLPDRSRSREISGTHWFHMYIRHSLYFSRVTTDTRLEYFKAELNGSKSVIAGRIKEILYFFTKYTINKFYTFYISSFSLYQYRTLIKIIRKIADTTH